MFPDGKFFDLSQTPGQRARYGITGLPTLTKSCQNLWSEDAKRFMRLLVASCRSDSETNLVTIPEYFVLCCVITTFDFDYMALRS